MPFDVVAGLVGALGGATASLVGFGIGSMLTPLLTPRTGAKLAVALVAIPHFTGTALRLWRLRADVDRSVLVRFGLLSAAGGLLGALLHAAVPSAAVRVAFGALLVLAGLGGLTGLAGRVRFAGASAWAAGGISGFFGGLAGTQGGVRSAALLGFDLPRDAFIATSTAVALLIDLARVPVYVAGAASDLAERWPLLLAMTAGVAAGTLAGERLLRRVPERAFRRVVSALILVLGLSMFVVPEG